jgi:hypothetical protein
MAHQYRPGAQLIAEIPAPDAPGEQCEFAASGELGRLKPDANRHDTAWAAFRPFCRAVPFTLPSPVQAFHPAVAG